MGLLSAVATPAGLSYMAGPWLRPPALFHAAFPPPSSGFTTHILTVVTEKHEGSRSEVALFQAAVRIRFATVLSVRASHVAKPRVHVRGHKACGFREAGRPAAICAIRLPWSCI